MTSVSPFSSTALSLLVRVSDLTPTGRQQTGNAATNILKAANGVSSEPSQGMKSATSAAGLLAVDLADKSSEEDASSTDNEDHKITSFVFANLGTFGSIEEAKAYVENNDSFSAKEKKDWFATLDQAQRNVDSIEKFKSSDLYKLIKSGKIQAEDNARKAASEAANGPDFFDSRQKIETLNNFLIEHGRQGLPNYDKLLERAKYA
jgi:hypothetical protein